MGRGAGSRRPRPAREERVVESGPLPFLKPPPRAVFTSQCYLEDISAVLKCNEKGATQYYQRVTGTLFKLVGSGSGGHWCLSSRRMVSRMVEMTTSSPTAVLIIMW